MHGRLRRVSCGLAVTLGTTAALAQISVRPDSRPASYPTAPVLPPPIPLRFVPVWEREADERTGERIVQLASTSAVVWSLSESGQLTMWDGATGDPTPVEPEMDERWDPSAPLVTACGTLMARSLPSGKLVVFPSGGAPGEPIEGARSVQGLENAGQARVLGAWSFEGPEGCDGALSAGVGDTVLLVGSRDGRTETRALSSQPATPPQPAGGRAWALAGPDATRELVPLDSPEGRGLARRHRSWPLPHAWTLGSSGPGARGLAVAGDAFMGVREGRSGRQRWVARIPTAAGTPPLVLGTLPGPGFRGDPETLVIVGTLDGEIIARREDNGHLAWSAQAAGRLQRPLVPWHAAETPGDPDRTRLLASAVGSRLLEAFRAADGMPAGSLQVGTDSAAILAGPVLVGAPGETRCVIAWRAWAGAPTRLLSLRML